MALEHHYRFRGAFTTETGHPCAICALLKSHAERADIGVGLQAKTMSVQDWCD